VKLADRITNLQPPPQHWSIEKITDYHKQAVLIAASLKGGNEYLENRLQEKISDYSKYCLPVSK
jgi:guanosine-3',5'-bis(diphosphate) 3'-pyrophosphohydrolase